MVNELYFDTTDIANTNEDFKRGDVVKMYKESTKLDYPCLILSCEQLEVFRVEAIKGILASRSLTNNGNQVYNVYIHMQGQMVKIGLLPNNRLRFVLSNHVFDVFDKKIHLDDATTVTGDMLFALCTV